MHFLLIYPNPGVIGGIETTIVRASRWLVSKGYRVTLLTLSGKNWSDLLPKEVRFIELGERFRELYYIVHAKKLLRSLQIQRPDVIKSFDLGSSWIAAQIAFIFGNKCKVIAGLYNPNLFYGDYAPTSLHWWQDEYLYLKNYLRCIPDNARFFCGVDQMAELKDVYRQKGELWPIPIDKEQFEPAKRNPMRGRIISIGRLSIMKEYNLYMIDIVRELLRKGYDITWTVYGVGKYEAEMRKRISQQGLDRLISLEGAVPFTKIWRVLEEANLFVGMGTAVLEAALFKVPNVVAVPYDIEGLAYGPVYNLPPGSVLPCKTEPPKLRMIDEIERILNLSCYEYEAEGERVYQHVKVYETEASMQHFLRLVMKAQPIILNPSFYFTNYFQFVIRKIFNFSISSGNPQKGLGSNFAQKV